MPNEGDYKDVHLRELEGNIEILESMATADAPRLGLKFVDGPFKGREIYIKEVEPNNPGTRFAYICDDRLGKFMFNSDEPGVDLPNIEVCGDRIPEWDGKLLTLIA